MNSLNTGPHWTGFIPLYRLSCFIRDLCCVSLHKMTMFPGELMLLIFPEFCKEQSYDLTLSPLISEYEDFMKRLY